MGETRVDLLHLLEDLRDAYPGALEETILTEIVANSLDSGASAIWLETDPAQRTLTVIDNGAGMGRRELARYHDLAATTKRRGHGIGFAGVGIKLGLLACDEVLTETRRGKTHVASTWGLASRHRAPWKWTPPPGLVAEHGTAVRLTVANPLSELLDSGYLEAALLRHFQPLFESLFDDVLAASYPRGVRFAVNRRALVRRAAPEDSAALAIRVGRRRKPSAVGYLVRSAQPLAEEECGIAVSTLGKVIKRGWEWLGVTPAAPEHVGGMIEVPPLAECLTLSKADFIRTGARGATYLAYRKTIQHAVGEQLAAWGDVREPEEARRPKTRRVERDLQNVLIDLAAEFPLLATLVDHRPGGQRRLALATVDAPAEAEWDPAAALATGELAPPREIAEPAEIVEAEPGAGAPHEPSAEEIPPPPETKELPDRIPLPTGRGPRRPARYRIAIRFESRPEDEQLARLVEATVWVNDTHPAYRRALGSRSEGYHLALSVAMALAPFAVESPRAQEFVSAFLARWGEAAS